jgi:hypothetical protein
MLDDEKDIYWIRKKDVEGVKLYELSLCFDAQIRGYEEVGI